MTDNIPASVGKQFAALSRLPAHRQFGLVLGLAVVVALAIGAVLWAMQPRYVVLLTADAEQDFQAADQTLTQAGIEPRIDERSGALMVPEDRVREARLQLSGQGLPRQGDFGFELLEESLALGTSRTIENEHVRRALEGEIERTIAKTRSVRSARVLLALPERSSFIRERAEPSASVFLEVVGGRLDEAHVAGIVHLVAMSVPELDASNVAVIDDRGQLLSQASRDGMLGLSTQQRDYTRQLEEDYRRRIENVLSASVGDDSLRVSVTADVDFTQVETASESYGSDQPAILSESVTESENVSGATGGVPGALTNQPPAGGQVAVVDGLADETAQGAGPASTNRSSLRNFQNDRTINYIREAPASLQRLSIAVVVDDRIEIDEAGTRTRAPRSEEELAVLGELVRDAVGFDEQRGDQLNVSNQSFREFEMPPAAAPEPVWQQPWVWDLARYVLAAGGILFLVLFVLRPVLRNLASMPAHVQALPAGGADPELLSAQQAEAEAKTPLGRARRVAEQDPRLVAHVVRQWMDEDDD